MRSSRSRKSLKRQESLDDMYIDRLSQPVDHSKLKRRIERERKREFERSKSKFRQRSQSARKSSKSAKKRFLESGGMLLMDNHDDQWRGAFDFTRISCN